MGRREGLEVHMSSELTMLYQQLCGMKRVVNWDEGGDDVTVMTLRDKQTVYETITIPRAIAESKPVIDWAKHVK